MIIDSHPDDYSYQNTYQIIADKDERNVPSIFLKEKTFFSTDGQEVQGTMIAHCIPFERVGYHITVVCGQCGIVHRRLDAENVFKVGMVYRCISCMKYNLLFLCVENEKSILPLKQPKTQQVKDIEEEVRKLKEVWENLIKEQEPQPIKYPTVPHPDEYPTSWKDSQPWVW
jgi:hypothetical protein